MLRTLNAEPFETTTNFKRALGFKKGRSWMGWTVSLLNPCDWMEWGLAVTAVFAGAGGHDAEKIRPFSTHALDRSPFDEQGGPSAASL